MRRKRSARTASELATKQTPPAAIKNDIEDRTRGTDEFPRRWQSDLMKVEFGLNPWVRSTG